MGAVKLRNVSSILGDAVVRSGEPGELLKAAVSGLGVMVYASCLLANAEGMVLEYYKFEDYFPLSLSIDASEKFIEPLLNEQLKNVKEVKSVSLSSLYIKNASKDVLIDYRGVILPLICAGKRVGTMLLYKKAKAFSEEEVLSAQIVQSFCAIAVFSVYDTQSLSKKRDEISVRSALDTLSYSEMEAVIYIFSEMGSDEGLIVASKVADKHNLTRSVIVNGLRKLESAGLIESRSLGMKGTYIKILNKKLAHELDKLGNLS